MNKFWKISKWILRAFLALVILDVLVVVFFNFYQPQLKKVDAIVVLGAAINRPSIYKRSLEGLRLYEQGMAPVIVVSGGQGFPGAITEAEYMRRAIESKAKGPVPIILEENSHSTYDNLNFSKEKLGGPDKSIIIVSDTFHLGRAYLVALREGFKPIYVSSPDQSYFGFQDLLYYYSREILATLAYLPKFIFG